MNPSLSPVQVVARMLAAAMVALVVIVQVMS